MTKIYLIRHAESIANTKGIYQGQSYDTDLSPLGKKQAKALGKRLADISFDAIYTSPLNRALQTAKTIEKNHSSPVAFFLERDLMETNHGNWEGKSKQEIATRWSDLYQEWMTNPQAVKFPGGEAYTETIQRVLSWFEKFQNMLPRDHSVVVVTHSNVIQILLASLQGIDFGKLWDMPVSQAASVTLIESHSPTRVIHQNDITHLAGLESDLERHAI